MDVQVAREELGTLANEIQVLADLANDEKRDFTPEEQEKWGKINGDYDQTKRSIELADRALEVRKQAEAPADGGNSAVFAGTERSTPDGVVEPRGQAMAGATEEQRSLAFTGWFLRQSGLDTTDEHEHAASVCGLNLNARNYDVSFRTGSYDKLRRELRADMGTGAGVGGETIPEGFVNALERSLLAFGGVRQVADVIRTATGNDLPWPHTNDTGNVGELLAEHAAAAELGVTTGAMVLQAHKYSSKLIIVSVELLQDSAFNLPQLIGEMAGERIGRITNTHFTTGDASSKPNGIVTASGLGKTAASATVIASDELFDLVHSVDPAYRALNPSWMMHDNILLVLRKLKDSQNQYLWNPGLTVGQPDTLLGYPVTINQDMQSSVATATKTILFGAMSKYKVRDVAGLRMRRLVERFAEEDHEAFIAFSRHDGDLLDAGTDPVKHLIQA